MFKIRTLAVNLSGKKGVVRFIQLLSVFILLMIILFCTQFFLSINKPVSANILVVEGWLPQFAIQMANKELQNQKYNYVITTGLKFDESDYYEISQNGSLIFYTHFKSEGNDAQNHHLLEIMAHIKKTRNNFSHLNIFINDSLNAQFRTYKNKYIYKINWEGKLSKIDSLIIQLDDKTNKRPEDRKLFVKGLRIDGRINIPFSYNSVMDIVSMGQRLRIINNFDSNAEKARMELIATGVDSSIVIAVPCKKVTVNRTLNSVLAFKEWLKTSKCEVKGINIVSQGIHSRRTWMTYKKVLGKSYNIGIISLPEDENKEFQRPKIFSILYETIGIIYYLIIFNYIIT